MLGMIESRDCLRVVLQTLFHFGICEKLGRKNLNRDRSVRACVPGLIDFSRGSRSTQRFRKDQGLFQVLEACRLPGRMAAII